MIRVTVLDEDTGDTETMRIGDGPEGYIVTCGPGCDVTHTQKYANGTVVVTIKPMCSEPGCGRRREEGYTVCERHVSLNAVSAVRSSAEGTDDA